MHNDLPLMITLAELERKQAERDRHARHLTELHALQRGEPGLFRRSLTALMSLTHASGRRLTSQPVTGFPAVRSDAAERAALRRTPFEQFRLHDV